MIYQYIEGIITNTTIILALAVVFRIFGSLVTERKEK